MPQQASERQRESKGEISAPLVEAMNDQGSLARASRIKKEVAPSGVANGNDAGGESERFAAAAATALAKGDKRYVTVFGLLLLLLLHSGRGVHSWRNAE